MSLSTKQQKFTQMIGKLIGFAYEKGYGLTFGDAYRDYRVFGHSGERKGYGNPNSNHKLRLAVDFNLWVDGQYIRNSDHPAYLVLGEYWESIGGAWGGRFSNADANHFSLEHQGRK